MLVSARIAARFFHTQAFRYELLDTWNDESLPKEERRYLYLDLLKVCSCLSDGTHMFPNLKAASFPQVYETIALNGAAVEPEGTRPFLPMSSSPSQTFLSNVEVVIYVHSAEAFPRVHPPRLASLGINRLRTLHVYHMSGGEWDSTGYLSADVGPQQFLEAIYVHLEEHFDAYLKRDPQHCQHLPKTIGSGDAPRTAEIIAAREWETVVYIRRYATGMVVHATAAAFPHNPPSRYPKLKHVTVDIGPDKHLSDEEVWKTPLLEPNNDDPGIDPDSTDRHILLRRFRFITLWTRSNRNGTITPGVLTDFQRCHVPDIIIRMGETGPAWILSGHPSSPPNLPWKPKPFVESVWRKVHTE